jgi:large subunit ribosomal protein L6
MSRVGKKPISLPKGVEVRLDGSEIVVKGPKGQVKTPLVDGISMNVDNGTITLSRKDEERQSRANHGLVRALLANGIKGVSEGFRRELEVIGVGYRAEVKGREVVFQLGYSHPINFKIPEGIEIAIEKAKLGSSAQVQVNITGVDKQKVGQTAAEIRSLREPDPYKGKGIKYMEEVIRRKAGKAAGK